MYQNVKHWLEHKSTWNPTLIVRMVQTHQIVNENGHDKCRNWKVYFYKLSFMNSKLRIQLTIHLDLVVKMLGYKFFILDTFPFVE